MLPDISEGRQASAKRLSQGKHPYRDRPQACNLCVPCPESYLTCIPVSAPSPLHPTPPSAPMLMSAAFCVATSIGDCCERGRRSQRTALLLAPGGGQGVLPGRFYELRGVHAAHQPTERRGNDVIVLYGIIAAKESQKTEGRGTCVARVWGRGGGGGENFCSVERRRERGYNWCVFFCSRNRQWVAEIVVLGCNILWGWQGGFGGDSEAEKEGKDGRSG